MNLSSVSPLSLYILFFAFGFQFSKVISVEKENFSFWKIQEALFKMAGSLVGLLKLNITGRSPWPSCTHTQREFKKYFFFTLRRSYSVILGRNGCQWISLDLCFVPSPGRRKETVATGYILTFRKSFWFSAPTSLCSDFPSLFRLR